MKLVYPVFTFVLLLVIGCKSASHESLQENDSTAVLVKLGVENKKLKEEWLNALKRRESKDYIDSIAKLSRSLTSEEMGWFKLIKSRATQWNTIRDSIDVPFGDISISDTIYVMLGYRGNDDGFTYKHNTVCFDLTALQRAYGSALDTINTNRMDRLFAHEYTHLLSKKWMKDHSYTPVSFRDSILWECWYEGFGMYRSMSAKWFPIDGSLSDASSKAFENLYPIFVEKMITMDTVKELTQQQKEWIHKKLSYGKMKDKWGALPVGVWLAEESNGDDENLTVWLNKGPEGIVELAKKHLPEKYKTTFIEVFND